MPPYWSVGTLRRPALDPGLAASEVQPRSGRRARAQTQLDSEHSGRGPLNGGGRSAPLPAADQRRQRSPGGKDGGYQSERCGTWPDQLQPCVPGPPQGQPLASAVVHPADPDCRADDVDEERAGPGEIQGWCCRSQEGALMPAKPHGARPPERRAATGAAPGAAAGLATPADLLAPGADGKTDELEPRRKLEPVSRLVPCAGRLYKRRQECEYAPGRGGDSDCYQPGRDQGSHRHTPSMCRNAATKGSSGARTIPAPTCPIPACLCAMPVLISGWIPVSTTRRTSIPVGLPRKSSAGI